MAGTDRKALRVRIPVADCIGVGPYMTRTRKIAAPRTRVRQPPSLSHQERHAP